MVKEGNENEKGENYFLSKGRKYVYPKNRQGGPRLNGTTRRGLLTLKAL